jgi:hypothetical protein
LLVALAMGPRWLLALAALLGVVTLAIGVEAATHPRFLAASPNGDVALPIEHQISGLLPNLSVGPKNTHAAFAAIDLPREVGRIVTDPLAGDATESPRSGDRVVESGPADGAGYLAFGAPAAVVSGTYVASFRLRAVDIAPGRPVGSLEIASNDRVLARHDLIPTELDARSVRVDTGRYVTIDVTVRFPKPAKVECRARADGGSILRLAAVGIEPADPRLSQGFRTRFPDLAKAILWVSPGLALLLSLAVSGRDGPGMRSNMAGGRAARRSS